MVQSSQMQCWPETHEVKGTGVSGGLCLGSDSQVRGCKMSDGCLGGLSRTGAPGCKEAEASW